MLNSDPCPETGFGNICSQSTTCKRTILSLYCVISNCYPLACVARGCRARANTFKDKCKIDLCTDRSHSQKITPYLITSISRGACRQQRRNSLEASLYSGHVQARVRVIDVFIRDRLPCKRESASVQVARVRTTRAHGGRSTRTLTRRVSPRCLKSMTSPMACL